MPSSRSAETGSPPGGEGGVHVCSLLDVHDVLARTGARHLVSVINEQLMLATPGHLDSGNHLKLAFNDITQPMPGLTAPSRAHVERLIAFVERWDHQGPLVVHCWAGISRSSAAAFIALCTLNPLADEIGIARHLRAASPTAQPNRRLVALADDLLERNGRMLAAVESIGDGALSDSARPFQLISRHA